MAKTGRIQAPGNFAGLRRHLRLIFGRAYTIIDSKNREAERASRIPRPVIVSQSADWRGNPHPRLRYIVRAGDGGQAMLVPTALFVHVPNAGRETRPLRTRCCGVVQTCTERGTGNPSPTDALLRHCSDVYRTRDGKPVTYGRTAAALFRRVSNAGARCAPLRVILTLPRLLLPDYTIRRLPVQGGLQENFVLFTCPKRHLMI